MLRPTLREQMVSSLSAEERAVVDTVAEFVDRDVRPVVRELEHANEFSDRRTRVDAARLAIDGERKFCGHR